MSGLLHFFWYLKKICISWYEERWGWTGALSKCVQYGVQQSLDLASSPRSIKLQMACFRQYIECTPSWLNSGVYGYHYWSVPLLWPSAVFYWWSNSQNAVQLQQHSGCWDLDGNSTHLSFPNRLLGINTRGVLRLCTQLEAILDLVPAVMARAG